MWSVGSGAGGPVPTQAEDEAGEPEERAGPGGRWRWRSEGITVLFTGPQFVSWGELLCTGQVGTGFLWPSVSP